MTERIKSNTPWGSVPMSVWEQAVDCDGCLIKPEIVDKWCREQTKIQGRGILSGKGKGKRNYPNRVTENQAIWKMRKKRR